MNITCFALDPGGVLRSEPEATAVAAWRAGAGPYWIHLSAAPAEAVATWLAGLGLDPELLELLQISEDETRIVPLGETVYVSFPVPAEDGSRKPAHFRFLCLERLVITMHPQVDVSSALDDELVRRARIREPTTAGVVCALALLQSGRLRRRVVTLRAQGDALADRMDANPQAVSLEEILALKRRVLALGGVVDEQLAVLEILKISDQAALPLSRLSSVFQVAIEITRATDRDIDRLDGRVNDLNERYDSAQQEKANRRLGLLTVISAIFLPLTLVTGIYGMNFDLMPELHSRYGYPAVLAGMALLAVGLAWYFRTRWWRS